MLEYLTSKGYAVWWGSGIIILSHKDRPDVTLDYPTLKAAYEAQGGPKHHLQYTGGRG